MNQYSDKISLIKNFRGVYDLDTFKGCYNGLISKNKGCYDECYAAKFAKQYGYKFNESFIRNFTDIDHLIEIRRQIKNIDMPFIRIGVSGDPSYNWTHTIKIISLIYELTKIVIVTKHWNILSDNQLKELSKYKVIINTSVSALDTNNEIQHRLYQYERIKKYCKSILRVVSCDFNLSNIKGMYLNEIQNILLNKQNVIDNVLRPSKSNVYVKHNIIKIKKEKFITTDLYFSKNNDHAYIGICDKCPDMCGLNL